ncbi:MAG TPA: CPBP family intramembrane glutamate endopeptidase, partial [Myxococcaceae bacterium]|nr:CPBP family intramembrane glutamate endopeptidase [Myxococcaceae bacterium]
MLLICVTFSLLITVGVLSQLLNTAFGLWFTEIFGFLAPAWILLRLSGRDPVRWARASFPGWGLPAFGFLIGVVNFFVVVIPIQYFTTPLLPSSWKEHFDAARIFEQQTPVELALIVLGITIAAPWCEE